MKSDSFAEFVLDQLDSMGPVEYRSMFGGYGLYFRDAFFGIVFDGRLYFKTDKSSRADYAERKMKPFQPNSKQTLKTYYEVPPDIIEDSDRLVVWARRATKCEAAGKGR